MEAVRQLTDWRNLGRHVFQVCAAEDWPLERGTQVRRTRQASSSCGRRGVGHRLSPSAGSVGEKREAAPDVLHHVDESSLATMAPGEVLLLDDVVSLRNAIEPAFFAVLACPLCGARALITLAQYFGTVPVMCGSKTCSGLFRIVNQDSLVYLPAN